MNNLSIYLSIYRHVSRQETLVHYSRLHWGLHVRNYDAYILYSQTGAHSEHHFSVRTFLSPQERKDVVKEKCLEFESGVFLRLLILACPPGLAVQPTTACCHRLPLVSEAQSPLSVSFQCCFTSTETIRRIWDGEPRTYSSFVASQRCLLCW